MPRTLPDELREQLRAESDRLLVGRARLGLAIALGGILLFAAVDLWAGSRPLASLYALKSIGVALAVIGYAVLGRPRSAPYAAVVAWLSVATACILIALSGIVSGESTGVAILCVSLALTASTFFPWGIGPQLATVAAAAAAFGANEYWVESRLDSGVSVPGAVAAVAALLMSVWLTYERQRHRLALAGENLERKRAEAQIVQLNEALEQRVRVRTADLEAAKQELEHEIAGRRHTSEALRESQKRLQDIVDNSTAVIYLKDVHGRYLLINTRYETLFHVTRAEVIGKTDYDIFPATAAAAFQENDRQVLEANEALHFEEIAPHDDGPHTYISVKFPLHDAAGVVYAVCGISTDITALKEAQERARQHQVELTHVLRLGTMGEMAAGLAHEINQPLGAIANYAQGCRRRMQAGSIDLPELGHVIEQIADEALRAGEILRRLRQLVRKESPCHEVVDVNQVVIEAVRVMEPEARHRGTAIRLAMAPERPKAKADSIQIEQVVLNLLLNAVEALQAVPSDERTLMVQTTVVEGSAIEVSVRDTGVGLAPALVDKVFDPFFTTKPNGLGMGLAICRSIVEAHDGRLWATRNPDRGSTFHFTLPLARS